jgi:ERCC4-type nuclease
VFQRHALDHRYISPVHKCLLDDFYYITETKTESNIAPVESNRIRMKISLFVSVSDIYCDLIHIFRRSKEDTYSLLRRMKTEEQNKYKTKTHFFSFDFNRKVNLFLFDKMFLSDSQELYSKTSIEFRRT